MQLFILYQTDIWKTNQSKVCFGVFSEKNMAIDAAKENDLYTNQSEIVIEEIELNTFREV